MTLYAYQFCAAIIIFLTGLAFSYYPLWRNKEVAHAFSLELGEALASGIFLGAAFFHMLPDAIHLFNERYPKIHYPISEVIAIGGFVFLNFLERLSLSNKNKQISSSLPYILTFILIIHALTEGAALGISKHFSETLMIFIAITAHKGTESFSLTITLLKYKLPRKEILAFIIIFACMTPMGIAIGSLLNQMAQQGTGELAAICFNAFAAGTFLYMSTLHHHRFHEHVKESESNLEFCALVLGITIMAVIAVWA